MQARQLLQQREQNNEDEMVTSDAKEECEILDKQRRNVKWTI